MDVVLVAADGRPLKVQVPAAPEFPRLVSMAGRYFVRRGEPTDNYYREVEAVEVTVPPTQ